MRHIWIFVNILVVLQIVRCESPGDKLASFLKGKFQNYDRISRPYYGGQALKVTVSGYVLDMYDIDEKNQEFTVNLYLRHEWKDPRMEFIESEVGASKIMLNKEYADKLWKMDSFIVNERESKGHDLVSENELARIQADGTVLISARYSIKASCQMSLGWFPFDRHTCPIVIESYAYNTNDVDIQWKMDDLGSIKKAIGVATGLSSIRFEVAAVNCRKESVTLSTNSYSRLAVEFFLVRSSSRYVYEVYLPAIVITLLSFITLLLGTGTPKSRLHMSVMLLGLLILLMALTARNMPPVSYQTALDFYLVTCLLIVVCVVTVNIAFSLMLSSSNESNGIVRLRSCPESNNAEDEGKEVLFDVGPRFSPRANRVFTILFKLRFGIPFIFIVFNVMYWMIVLIGSNIFPDDFVVLDKNVVL